MKELSDALFPSLVSNLEQVAGRSQGLHRDGDLRHQEWTDDRSALRDNGSEGDTSERGRASEISSRNVSGAEARRGGMGIRSGIGSTSGTEAYRLRSGNEASTSRSGNEASTSRSGNESSGEYTTPFSFHGILVLARVFKPIALCNMACQAS